MTHLGRTELVDYVEASPALSQDHRRHVETCETCRAEADVLRTVRALAQADDAPEPSPLFWDHFAARVSDAVRDEVPGTASQAGTRWFATWVAAATMAVVIMMTVVWRTPLHAPGPVAVAVPVVDATGTDPSAFPIPDDVETDEAWAVVRTAAQDLGWDDAHAEGLEARPGAAEGVALELTADERFELGRLIDEALKRNGV